MVARVPDARLLVSQHTTSSVRFVPFRVDSLHDLCSELVEGLRTKRLGEDVSDVLRRGHVEELDCLLVDVVPHEVVPNSRIDGL